MEEDEERMSSRCRVAEYLLPQILKMLYRKLTLTRGQVAIASELYVIESVETQGKDPVEAVSNALRELCTHHEVTVDEEGLRVDAKCGTECLLGEVCPLPHYIAAYARKATSRRLSLVSHEIKGGGECTMRYELR